jgi:hypothetical protein
VAKFETSWLNDGWINFNSIKATTVFAHANVYPVSAGFKSPWLVVKIAKFNDKKFIAAFISNGTSSYRYRNVVWR